MRKYMGMHPKWCCDIKTWYKQCSKCLFILRVWDARLIRVHLTKTSFLQCKEGKYRFVAMNQRRTGMKVIIFLPRNIPSMASTFSKRKIDICSNPSRWARRFWRRNDLKNPTQEEIDKLAFKAWHKTYRATVKFIILSKYKMKKNA